MEYTANVYLFKVNTANATKWNGGKISQSEKKKKLNRRTQMNVSAGECMQHVIHVQIKCAHCTMRNVAKCKMPKSELIK